MKRIVSCICFICIGAVSICLAGCGNKEEIPAMEKAAVETPKETEEAPITQEAEQAQDNKQEVRNEEREIPAAQTLIAEQAYKAPEVQKKLTFEDLSKRRFDFASGVGGWNESFTIEKDGSFEGLFNDSDMGDIGEGYPNGTMYLSQYTGHFTDLVQLDEYTYQMKLKDIAYDTAPGKEEIKDQMKMIYTASYCLGGNDTFMIYLPGKPVSQISEAVRIWFNWAIEEGQSALQDIAIVDEKNEYGIYSVPRPTPLEEATSEYESYKSSYDYWGEQAASAETTVDMKEAVAMQYKMSDDCLNFIWKMIKQNVKGKRYQQILTEQRNWIALKEQKKKELEKEYEGSSITTLVINSCWAEMTIKRCQELLGYLK